MSETGINLSYMWAKFAHTNIPGSVQVLYKHVSYALDLPLNTQYKYGLDLLPLIYVGTT